MTKGPKPKVTPAITERIAREMALGLSLQKAAVRCMVATRTVDEWMAKGRQGRAPYDAFYAAIEKAKSDREQRWLAAIDAACKADKTGKIAWQAAAWKLERSNPDAWGRPPQLLRVTSVEKPNEKETDVGSALAKLGARLASAAEIEDGPRGTIDPSTRTHRKRG